MLKHLRKNENLPSPGGDTIINLWLNRRCAYPLITWLFWVVFIFTGTAVAGITTEEHYVYYDVSGNTVQELRHSINRNTRFLKNRFDARTRWQIKWQFSYVPRQKKCKITTVIIDASIEYLLPRWQQATQHPEQRLVDQWQRYSKELLAHEKRHGDYAKAAAFDVERKILAADDTSFAPHDCSQLKQIANQRAQSVIDNLEKQQLAFDKQTDHGRNTGARFP